MKKKTKKKTVETLPLSYVFIDVFIDACHSTFLCITKISNKWMNEWKWNELCTFIVNNKPGYHGRNNYVIGKTPVQNWKEKIIPTKKSKIDFITLYNFYYKCYSIHVAKK